MFVFPGFLVLHAIGMGLAAGLSAALDLRVLGVAAGMPLVEFRRLLAEHRGSGSGSTRCLVCCC